MWWKIAAVFWVFGDTISSIAAKSRGFYELNPLFQVVNHLPTLEAGALIFGAKLFSLLILYVISRYSRRLPWGSRPHDRIIPASIALTGLVITINNASLLL